mmetsp:Transcript_41271/g.36615  ORF Transcript_41271/g.36615 Transcript_41271/m.36615 type:complete len:127 (+) Transcript_41271:47-427(+)
MASIDDDEELNIVKQKSDELESIYKRMEHIKRENLLFESWLIRNQANMNFKEDEPEMGRKGKNKKKELRKLTNDEKYEIANAESEALKKNIEDGRIRSDSILETLRAILEETDQAITEIRKDAFDF